MVDLDRIKAWLDRNKDQCPFDGEREEAVDHLEALVAEVERLRNEKRIAQGMNAPQTDILGRL